MVDPFDRAAREREQALAAIRTALKHLGIEPDPGPERDPREILEREVEATLRAHRKARGGR